MSQFTSLLVTAASWKCPSMMERMDLCCSMCSQTAFSTVSLSFTLQKHCICYLLLCNIFPQIWLLITTNIYYLAVFVGWKFRSSLAGWFWFRVSHEILVKLSVWSQSLQGSAEDSASKFTHKDVPHYVGLSSDCLGLLMVCHVDCWRERGKEEKEREREVGGGTQDESCSLFYNLISEVTSYNFCHILLTGSMS